MSPLSQNGPVGPGTRVSRYEIESFLGAGGMGQVYVARDTTLDRRVALKVLPAGCTADRVARFLREARAASALNHPGIVSVYDAGEDGVPFLAMELIDGQPLSAWMRGRRSVRRAIELMAQVAEGLARAHAAGIVHRDIKPDNILVGEGFAKVVDFGVAKLTEGNDGEDGHTAVKTVDGTLIGTISYMSPEQTEARPVDYRSDIFSFGVVLYEILTGHHPFQKARQVDTLHSIAHDTPSLDRIPEPLRRIVRRCLEKEPDARYHSMKDIAHDLRDVLTAGDLRSGAPAARRWLRFSAAVLIVAAAVGLTRFVMTRAAAPPAAQPVRMSIVPPPGHQFEFLGGAGAPMISPDGHSIVFTASRDGKRQLWLRRLDTTAPEPLAGTDGAINPFWSPDSRSIGFFADEKLKRIDIGGGEPAVLCDAPLGRGGTWNQNDTILFAGRATPIMRISASGSGTPVAVTELDRSEGETTHRWPVFLPDGRHFLFIAGRSGAALPFNSICVGSLDRKMRKVVMNAPTHALYSDGHLLYVRGGTLHAQRFDEKKLAVIGEPVTLPERQIDLDFGFTRNLLSVSAAGTLVYQTASSVRPIHLTWFDRAGKQLGVVDQPAMFASIAFSPDERFIYVGYRPTAAQSNIWSYDLQRGVKTRLTFGNTRDSWPIPSPDGKAIAYASFGSAQERQANVRLRELATGMETILLQRDFGLYPTDWSPDGRSLLMATGAQGGPASSLTRSDIFWLDMRDRKLHPFMQTPDIEAGARFSPDGKWVAYSSDEGGPTTEIYLAPFPPTGAKWQVSDQGGFAVRWRADGKELFYATPDSRLMAVPIVLGGTPSIGRPAELFQMRPGAGPRFVYAATADGHRFLVGTTTGDEELPPLTVVEHFDTALRAAMQQRRSAVTP